ncbi:hypothetical protein OROHE_013769 [Orobanche hederae]
MATNARSSNSLKSRPGSGDGSSSSKTQIDSKKKVVEGSSKNCAPDAKNRSTTTVSKMVKKTSSQSKAVTETVIKTREKKVFSLPGQKFDVPEEEFIVREPLRIFYESLSRQIPSSEMAEFWLMEHGILSPERAKKAYEKKQRKQKQTRTGTPIKSPPPARLIKSPPPTRPIKSPPPALQIKSPPPTRPIKSPPPTLQIKSPPPTRPIKSPPPTGGPLKPPPPSVSNKPESSKRPHPVPKNGEINVKKRIVNDSDDDDDHFVLSHRRRKV